MGIKVLIIEKSKSETFEQLARFRDDAIKENRYRDLVALAETISETLGMEGYEVRTQYGIDSLSSQDFSSVDCVITHPLIRQTKKIKELKVQYPKTGLIISVAEDTLHHFNEVIRDCDGTYILMKPCSYETLLSTVEESVRDSCKIK